MFNYTVPIPDHAGQSQATRTSKSAKKARKEAASQRCDHAKGMPNKTQLPFLAQSVAMEDLPEQKARIQEFMDRVWSSMGISS